MKRRKFIKQSSFALAGLGMTSPAVRFIKGEKTEHRESDPTKEYLKNILYTKEEIVDWLSGNAFPFAKYSAEFGWLLNDARFRDGIDDSYSTYTYGEYDERVMIHYRNKMCRINTYGDSFTQCHQVSDGETWQEILAAHLQEPIRNFGVGGWSVYQAYLRMLKEEKRIPAKYIIFNIYDDDHLRNLDSWRNIRRRKHDRFIEPTLPYIKVNLKESSYSEHANPCPTMESVYDLCDLNPTYDLFKDDFVLKIMRVHEYARRENPLQTYEEMMQFASEHGINVTITDNDMLRKTAVQLHRSCALFASKKIIEKIEKWALNNDKKVLYVLSFPASSIKKYAQTANRWDQSFVDFLKEKKLPYIDLMQLHMDEFSNYKLSIKEYLKRYYIGHYNPFGNLFCAFAIKDKLVEMLNPKPVSYDPKPQIFNDYPEKESYDHKDI